MSHKLCSILLVSVAESPWAVVWCGSEVRAGCGVVARQGKCSILWCFFFFFFFFLLSPPSSISPSFSTLVLARHSLALRCVRGTACPCCPAGAGLAALLAVGVYGVGPMYMTEAERSDYMALSGGPETGLSGGAGGVLTGQQAGAPAGSPGTTMSTGTF